MSVRVGILNLLADLRRDREIGVLLITHDLASARYSTTSTLVMYAGRILEAGPTAELIASPQHPYTQLLVESVPRRGAAARPAAKHAPGDRPAGGPARPAGCPFATRCPFRMPQCDTTMPGVTWLGDGRWLRCHRYPPD
jgi:peptide/nickel transport system ATP-binding protein